MYLIKHMYTFCFQIFFLVNNLHTSWHPGIIGLFKNFIKIIFKKTTAVTIAFYDNLNIAF